MHKLPPLPDPEGLTDAGRGYALRQYTPSQMQAYATEAVNDVLAGLEASMVAADLRINDMKNTGELRQREDHAALVTQVQDQP